MSLKNMNLQLGYIILIFSSAVNGLLFSKKCMDELGCFSNAPPFFNPLSRPVSLLPLDRKRINTTFELYTPEQPEEAVVLSNIYQDNAFLASQNIQSSRKTVFIIHGYRGKYYMPFIRTLKDALFEQGEKLNVFVINYSGGDVFLYSQTVANLRVVGAEAALFISRLQEMLNVNPKNVHMIGLSLGAHVAGYAGKRVQGLGRITGLSPAGPLFTGTAPEVRLDAYDAEFVDCTHTDGNSLLTGGLGTSQKMCQLNFYPNGGRNQPGCPKESALALAAWYAKATASEDDPEICSHIKSFRLEVSSVRNRDCPVYAVACDSQENYSQGRCGNCTNPDGNTICIPYGYYADRYLPENLPPRLSLFVDTTEEQMCNANE